MRIFTDEILHDAIELCHKGLDNTCNIRLVATLVVKSLVACFAGGKKLGKHGGEVIDGMFW